MLEQRMEKFQLLASHPANEVTVPALEQMA
jgi:hypothetical protein